MPETPLDDSQVDPTAYDIAMALATTPAVEFALDAANAFTLASLLQLALRHPQIGEPIAGVGREVIAGIRERMPPEVQDLIDRGFDPAWDTDASH